MGDDVCRLVLLPHERTLAVERGAALADVLVAQGVEFPCGGASLCGRCRVRVVEGSIPVTAKDAAVFTGEEIAAGWRLACQARVEGPLALEVAQWEASILTDEQAVPFEPAEGLGLAIDLGTTTLVVQAVDLANGEVLAVASGLNPQATHGADVMSRVEFALQGEHGAERLARIIRAGLGALIARALDSCGGGAREAVRQVILVGNTVMHHLFAKENVEPLAHAPFVLEHGGAREFTSDELGWALAARSLRIQFLPCLGGFVGSDLLAGIVACGLERNPAPAALIDLGTNGEIVLRARGRDRILCASTAAGPAFEGGGIRMGMRAGTGAIAHVRVEDGRLACQVLGHAAPSGICGSGLVDAVAAGLELGGILPDGRLAAGARDFPLAGRVSLSRGDIRELQLAKAAISSGLRLLVRHAGMTLEEIGALHLAGAFGNYVDVASAHRIGLLEVPPGRILAAGNTALRGARMLLLVGPSRREAAIAAVVGLSEHVPLVTEPGFQDAFVDCLALEPAPAQACA